MCLVNLPRRVCSTQSLPDQFDHPFFSSLILGVYGDIGVWQNTLLKSLACRIKSRPLSKTQNCLVTWRLPPVLASSAVILCRCFVLPSGLLCSLWLSECSRFFHTLNTCSAPLTWDVCTSCSADILTLPFALTKCRLSSRPVPLPLEASSVCTGSRDSRPGFPSTYSTHYHHSYLCSVLNSHFLVLELVHPSCLLTRLPRN